MIEPTKVNTKIAKEIIKHRGEIQLIKHNWDTRFILRFMCLLTR
jgi:hypothetical protein